MEAARSHRGGAAFWIALTVLLSSSSAWGQNARSKNFLVHAPTQQLADAVARDAETFRNQLAEYWLGRRLPDWPTPCPIRVVAGPNLAAQGVTTYNRSPVGNFQMKVVGTPERILDSVLPHEVTHTILATHFGRPLPRWADEGICTTVEHQAERQKHEAKLREFLRNRRGIAMNRLFLLTEYPADMLPMYAQGYSVCRFLIEQSGPRRFISFLEDYMQHPSWTANIQKHYGYASLAKLQERWLDWVAQGSGPVEAFVSTRSKQQASTAANEDPGGEAQPDQLRLAAAGSPAPRTPAPRSSTSRSGAPRTGKARGQASRSQSTPSDVGQSQPSGSQRSANADRGTALSRATGRPGNDGTAEAGVGSWYKRRRQQTARGQLASAAPPTAPSTAGNESASTGRDTGQAPARQSAPLAPPSVLGSGRYSVSQPQPVRSFGAARTGRRSPAGSPYRR